MPFSSRMRINGEQLNLFGDTAGSLRMSSSFVNGELTVSFRSTRDLTVNANGDLDATINGHNQNDTFNFAAATGNYTFNTGAGNDIATGGSGNDRFNDGLGNDTYDGSGGLDTFAFASEGDTPDDIDRINNYVIADDDLEFAPGSNPVVTDTGDDEVTITLADGDQIIVRGSGVDPATINNDVFGPGV